MEDKAKQVTPQQLSKLLADNNREEQSAISGYLSLLEVINQGGITAGHNYKKVISTINEIIADEMNHTQRLAALISELSGIEPNQS